MGARDMIGIVLAAHGSLPEALLESADMILGDTENIFPLKLMPGDTLEGLIDRMRDAVQEAEAGQGVLILLDLFGGTPSNAAALISQQIEGVHAVSGVNVPMLLETLLARQTTEDVQALAETATNSGAQGIVNVVKAFQQYQAQKQEANNSSS
jgi:mannose/fructose/sorbose-specific phosphotransferase system IIA component